MKTAIIYLRVSSVQQAKKELPIKRDLKENMTISNIGRLARKHKIRA
jgi:hypothetical protein